jgi:hypothetical protein
VRVDLQPGHNQLAIGGPRTPYHFQVTLEPQAAPAPLPSQRLAAAESFFSAARRAVAAGVR